MGKSAQITLNIKTYANYTQYNETYHNELIICRAPLSIMTLSIIQAMGKVTLSNRTLSRMTLSITASSRIGLIGQWSRNNTQHKNIRQMILSVMTLITMN